ncbi:MAG TPA: HD domain-containing protein [Solirubrobacteraceae bacterium]|jgi:3'-5' exoribonuclease|nr:HD domain-containing protein [Solirubrobacteraceae bacterium]
MLLRDAIDGTDLDQVLLVREVERRSRREGGEFLRLTLGDRSGQVTAMVWEDVEEATAMVAAGSPVHIVGRYVVHPRYGAQVNLRALRAPEPGSYDPAELFDGPVRAAEQLEADLRQLIATIQRPALRTLLESLIGVRSDRWPAYRDAPAAKFYHQAYRHGLLEHSLTVGQAVSAISATFPGIDRDVAVTGALLHDIGKLDAYTDEPGNIDLTDDGRLQGEIALGYYRVRREIEEIDGFPPTLAKALLHIILSHHGSHEHGSPVLPATREATLVHMVDNLGGRLGSFDRLEKELRDGERWSAWDRAIGGGAYFAAQEPVEATALDAA